MWKAFLLCTSVKRLSNGPLCSDYFNMELVTGMIQKWALGFYKFPHN